MLIIHPSNRMLGGVLDGKMSEKTSLTSGNLHHSSRYKSFKPRGKLLQWGQSDKLGQKSLQGRWYFPLLRKSLLSFLFINLKSFGSASYISPLDRKRRVLSGDKQGWPCWVTGIQAEGLRCTPCLPILWHYYRLAQCSNVILDKAFPLKIYACTPEPRNSVCNTWSSQNKPGGLLWHCLWCEYFSLVLWWLSSGE